MSNFRKHTSFTKGMHSQKGFTLVEAIVTLVVMAIVAAITVVSLVPMWQTYKATERQDNAENLYMSMNNAFVNIKSDGRLGQGDAAADNTFLKVYQENIDNAWTDENPSTEDTDVIAVSGDDAAEIISYIDDSTGYQASTVGFQHVVGSTGHYVVELNPTTGYVYGVFYSEVVNFSGSDGKARYEEASKARDDKSALGNMNIAYYGGTIVNTFDEDDVVLQVGYFEFSDKLSDGSAALLDADYYPITVNAEEKTATVGSKVSSLVIDTADPASSIADTAYGVLVIPDAEGDTWTPDNAYLYDTKTVTSNGKSYKFYSLKTNIITDTYETTSSLTSVLSSLSSTASVSKLAATTSTLSKWSVKAVGQTFEFDVNQNFAATTTYYQSAYGLTTAKALTSLTKPSSWEIRTAKQMQHIGQPYGQISGASKYVSGNAFNQTHNIEINASADYRDTGTDTTAGWVPIGADTSVSGEAARAFSSSFSGATTTGTGASAVTRQYTVTLGTNFKFARAASSDGTTNISFEDGNSSLWRNFEGIFAVVGGTTAEVGNVSLVINSNFANTVFSASGSDGETGAAFGLLAGALANGGTISNASVEIAKSVEANLAVPALATDSSFSIGAIAGTIQGGTVTGTSFTINEGAKFVVDATNVLAVSAKFAGGIVGCIPANSTSSASALSCKVDSPAFNGTGTLSVIADNSVGTAKTSCPNCTTYAGGLVGYAIGRTNVTLDWSDVNLGSVKLDWVTSKANNAVAYAGGLIGYKDGSLDNVQLTSDAGIGRIQANGVSFNNAASQAYAGGVAGYVSGSSSNVKFILDNAAVWGVNANTNYADGYMGGIFGYIGGALNSPQLIVEKTDSSITDVTKLNIRTVSSYEPNLQGYAEKIKSGAVVGYHAGTATFGTGDAAAVQVLCGAGEEPSDRKEQINVYGASSANVICGNGADGDNVIYRGMEHGMLNDHLEGMDDPMMTESVTKTAGVMTATYNQLYPRVTIDSYKLTLINGTDTKNVISESTVENDTTSAYPDADGKLSNFLKMKSTKTLDGWYTANEDGTPGTKILNRDGTIADGASDVEGYTSGGKLHLTGDAVLYACWETDEAYELMNADGGISELMIDGGDYILANRGSAGSALTVYQASSTDENLSKATVTVNAADALHSVPYIKVTDKTYVWTAEAFTDTQDKNGYRYTDGGSYVYLTSAKFYTKGSASNMYLADDNKDDSGAGTGTFYNSLTTKANVAGVNGYETSSYITIGDPAQTHSIGRLAWQVTSNNGLHNSTYNGYWAKDGSTHFGSYSTINSSSPYMTLTNTQGSNKVYVYKKVGGKTLDGEDITNLLTLINSESGTTVTETYFGMNGIATLTGYTEPSSATGKTLDGWYTSSGTKVLDADGSIVNNVSGYTASNVFAVSGGEQTLYAQWIEELKDADLSGLKDIVYDGTDTSKQQNPVVKNAAGNTLTEGVDYTVSYSTDTKNVGTVTVTVKGMGAYTGTATGTYQITKRPVTFTGEDATQVYNGKKLTDSTVIVEGLVAGETVTSTATGSQTVVGNSANPVSITWNGSAKESNYQVSTNEGTLTVTPITTPIIITADSNSKTYDGTALTDSGYSYTTGILVTGDTLSATVTGSQLNVGSSANVVTSYKVTNNSGYDVTNCYTFGTSVDGTLEVTKANQTLKFRDDSVEKQVGDDAFTNTLTGAKTTVTYTSSNESVATVNSSTGEVTIVGEGTTTITASAVDDGNYNAATASYTLVVKNAKITLVSTKSDSSYTASFLTGNAVDSNNIISGYSAPTRSTWTLEGWYAADGTKVLDRYGAVVAGNGYVSVSDGKLVVEKGCTLYPKWKRYKFQLLTANSSFENNAQYVFISGENNTGGALTSNGIGEDITSTDISTTKTGNNYYISGNYSPESMLWEYDSDGSNLACGNVYLGRNTSYIITRTYLIGTSESSSHTESWSIGKTRMRNNPALVCKVGMSTTYATAESDSDGKWYLDSVSKIVYTYKYDSEESDSEIPTTLSSLNSLFSSSSTSSAMISYEKNSADASGQMDKQELVSDVGTKLNACGFVREGYTFAGWNTKADGTGVSYSDQERVLNIAQPGETVTLYAQWKKVSTVKYNANGGSGSIDASTVVEGSSVTLPQGGMTRSGYTQTGWNSKADGTGTSYALGANVSFSDVSNGATLYAQWSNTTGNRNVVISGANVTNSLNNYAKGSVVTLELSLDKGFTLDDVTANVTLSDLSIKGNTVSFTMPDSDIELTAHTHSAFGAVKVEVTGEGSSRNYTYTYRNIRDGVVSETINAADRKKLAPEAPLVADEASVTGSEDSYWVYYGDMNVTEWQAMLVSVVNDENASVKFDSFTSRFDENASPIHVMARTYIKGVATDIEAIKGDAIKVLMMNNAAAYTFEAW